jgi:DNA-binding response OmpR family regulator
VLVVDDEASIRDLLAKTLALAEYDVDVAPDGVPRSSACGSIPTIC